MRARQVRSSAQEVRRHKPDYLLVVVSGILLSIGVLLMVAISPALTAQSGVPGSYFVTRQLMACLVGVALFLVFAKTNTKILRLISKPLIVASLVAAMLVVIISGVAFRWIQIGGLSFQPAELIKFTIVIVGSLFVADRVRDGSYNDDKKTLVPIGIGMAIVAFIVVILERDLGSMVVMIAIMLSIMLVANIPLKKLAVISLVILALGGVMIASTPYRRDRFSTFLNPAQDCAFEGYHACQALIAVGSGGLIGLGLGNSVQAYGYLPEASNDSIFAIYAEKFGFAGSLLLIVLYGVLFSRIIRIMQHTNDITMRLVSAGVLGWLAVQTAINIGAMLGLIPLKGITLPFISYGGTSIMFVMASLGLVFGASSVTTARKVTSSGEGSIQFDEKENNSFVGRRYGRPHHASIIRR